MTWKPIIINLETSGRQTIHGPYAALMALMIDWPCDTIVSRLAMTACLEAIDAPGAARAAAAWKAFSSSVSDASVDAQRRHPLPFVKRHAFSQSAREISRPTAP
ncbi:DUF982 domain-containing protein [Pararhizobium sp. DWP1-1-3]|uniref:DUF982 domain-containing protein n=1 Tax=Pararhizobium sp. DWP1-1-3 TaxID=2804652 RepID=UPI003CFA569B